METHLYSMDVIMPVYNQKDYIQKAIESVLAQQCDFEFRLIISDDCSTDDSAKIIKSYSDKFPEKILFIRNDSNLGLLMNYKILFDNCTSEYVSILEGDDYWIDPFKLQKAFDFFRLHPNAGILHTDCNILDKTGNIRKNINSTSKKPVLSGNIFEKLIKWNNIHPLTVTFKRELYSKYVSIEEYIDESFKTLDYPMWLDISLHSNFHYSSESTATYRLHEESLSNTISYKKAKEFMISNHRIRKYFLNKGNVSKQLRKKVLSSISYELLYFEFKYQNQMGINRARKQLRIYNFKSLCLYLLTLNQFFLKLFYLFRAKQHI